MDFVFIIRRKGVFYPLSKKEKNTYRAMIIKFVWHTYYSMLLEICKENLQNLLDFLY